MKKKKKKKNKAGYTATSCRRVGSLGGNARFSTFQLERDGATDQRTEERTDKASYRVACPQLKRKKRKQVIQGSHMVSGTRCP